MSLTGGRKGREERERKRGKEGGGREREKGKEGGGGGGQEQKESEVAFYSWCAPVIPVSGSSGLAKARGDPAYK